MWAVVAESVWLSGESASMTARAIKDGQNYHQHETCDLSVREQVTVYVDLYVQSDMTAEPVQCATCDVL